MPDDGVPPAIRDNSSVGIDDRVTPLGGCLNFRHLGGYRTDDGRTTRADLMFRTGWLDLQGGDVEPFRARGIRQVFDFRNDAERSRQPFALPGLDAADITGLPIDHGSMAGYLQALSADSSSAAETKRAMATMYGEMVHDGAGQFAKLLDLASKAGGPVMVACSLGKDRTGVASALLLAALGVSKDDIFGDYLISAEVYGDCTETLYEKMQFSARGIRFEVVRDILTVHPEYLEAAWTEMEKACGGANDFIRRRLNVSDEMRARLREKYTA